MSWLSFGFLWHFSFLWLMVHCYFINSNVTDLQTLLHPCAMETLMINNWTFRQSLSNMTWNMDYHLIIIIGKFVVQFCKSPHLHCFFLWKVCGEVQNWILDLMRWLGSLGKEQLHLHNHRRCSSILVYMPVREIVRPDVYIFVFLICMNDSIDSQGTQQAKVCYLEAGMNMPQECLFS